MMTRPPACIGRFAPSPTGPLHFGSLVAAMGSYLQARSQGGLWLLRIDNIDPPREQAGAAEDIIRTLDRYGFEWDRQICWQGDRSAAYDAAIEQLHLQQQVYPCSCSRKLIATRGKPGRFGIIYPGTCRDGPENPDGQLALRVRTTAAGIAFTDRLQGEYRQTLQRDTGDFVIRRPDGLYGYHLAVAVDDAWQGVTEVVRGADLLESTPRQIYLQQLLGFPRPDYAHLPVVVDERGDKLSKQTHAAKLPEQPVPTLLRAWQFLGQTPPGEQGPASTTEFWSWAISQWRLQAVGGNSERAIKS